MKRLSQAAAAAATLFVIVAPALQGQSSPTLAKVIQAAPGTQAEFVQRFTPKGFKKEQVERGSVLFGSAPQMRWNYTAPDQKLFVFDGQTSWFYTPAERQVLVTRLDDAARRNLPFAFLWDPAASRAYEVTERNEQDAVRIRMKSKDGRAELREIDLLVARNNSLIRRLEYTDRQGNRTVFEFSNFRRSNPSADQFRFVAPRGVEVVEN
jgi:chaperone LolA